MKGEVARDEGLPLRHQQHILKMSSTASTLHLVYPTRRPQIFKQTLLQTQSHDGEQEAEKDYGLRAWLNDNLSKYPKEPEQDHRQRMVVCA